MQRRGGIAIALAATVAAALASTAGAGSTAAAKTEALSCKSTLKIALVAPFTGGAGFLGNEQLSWTKYAVKTLAPKYGLKIKLVTGDLPREAGPAVAVTVAQKYVADKSVVAIVGPSTSGTAASSSQTLFAGGLAHISPSATRTSLTKGQAKEATPAFFRVVPDDGIQGPDRREVHGRQAEGEQGCGVRLPGAVFAGARRAGRGIAQGKGRFDVEAVGFEPRDRLLVVRDQGAERYGYRVLPRAKAGGCSDVRPAAARAGKEGESVRRRRRQRPGQVQGRLARTSPTSPLRSIYSRTTSRSSTVGRRTIPRRRSDRSGPPAYLAMQVALNAIKRACDAGKGQINDRRDVVRNVKRIVVKNSIVGGDWRFSTKTNDPLNGKFYIFQIQGDGTYKLLN